MSFFANNIKLLRQRKHLSQDAVAKDLNLTRSSLSGYENSTAQAPYDVLIKLSSFYNISIDIILKKDISKIPERHLSNMELNGNYDIYGTQLRTLVVSSTDTTESNSELVPIQAIGVYNNYYNDPEFIKDHVNNAEPGYFVQGTRVLLTQKATEDTLKKKKIKFSFFSQGIQNRRNTIHSDFLSKLFVKKKNYLRGIKTCNMAFFKQDCTNVNGFNNDFEGWGKEDSEFVVRLLNNGINRKNIRFNAIQFHLWHHENTRASLEQNDTILKNAIDNSAKWCDNGISQYL